MPIKFLCKHCGQKLSVGSQRAGTKANCPRCKEIVRVPGEEKPSKATLAASMLVMSGEGAAIEQAPPGVSAQAADEPTGPPLAGEYDAQYESSELVFDTAPTISTGDAPPGNVVQQTDYGLVSFPRYVLYAQAGVVAAVAIVSFTLGALMGGAFFRGSGGAVAAGPCTVTGVVKVTEGVTQKADEGAVVFILPDVKKVDERAPVAGLRPRDTEPEGHHRGLAILKEMGAGHARTDKEGRYKITVPRPGKYFLLVISRSKTGDGADIGVAKQRIARFFENANDLLGTQKYQFSAETLADGRKFDIAFE